MSYFQIQPEVFAATVTSLNFHYSEITMYEKLEGFSKENDGFFNLLMLAIENNLHTCYDDVDYINNFEMPMYKEAYQDRRGKKSLSMVQTLKNLECLLYQCEKEINRENFEPQIEFFIAKIKDYIVYWLPEYQKAAWPSS
jgi:hypothetical protein